MVTTGALSFDGGVRDGIGGGAILGADSCLCGSEPVILLRYSVELLFLRCTSGDDPRLELEASFSTTEGRNSVGVGNSF